MGDARGSAKGGSSSGEDTLANSLIHCAYTVPGSITVDRFMDKIVISNPGTMLISMEQYLEGGHSICRNPVLQKMFVFIGIGEKGGSGADVINKGWHDNGWVTPTLEEKSGPDRVEAVLFVSDKALIKKVANDIVDKHEFISKIVDKLSTNKEIGEKLAINEDFVDKLADIMVYLKRNPRVEGSIIAQFMGMSASNTRNYLNCLVLLDLIMADGANKNRVYAIASSKL